MILLMIAAGPPMVLSALLRTPDGGLDRWGRGRGVIWGCSCDCYRTPTPPGEAPHTRETQAPDPALRAGRRWPRVAAPDESWLFLTHRAMRTVATVDLFFAGVYDEAGSAGVGR